MNHSELIETRWGPVLVEGANLDPAELADMISPEVVNGSVIAAACHSMWVAGGTPSRIVFTNGQVFLHGIYWAGKDERTK